MFVMAPAVTSDTAPPACSRAPCLLTRDPTASLLSAVGLIGGLAKAAGVNMNSQATTTLPPSSQDGSSVAGDALDSVPFHPFARLPPARPPVTLGVATESNTNQERCLPECSAGRTSSDMVNGVGMNPSLSSLSLSSSNVCRVGLKSAAPRTVSIVIKNNGACSAAAGIISNSNSNSTVREMYAAATGNCNGGSCPPETSAAHMNPVYLARPVDGTRAQFFAQSVPSLQRMLIRQRGNQSSMSYAASAASVVADCTSISAASACGVNSDVVEQLQVTRSAGDDVNSSAPAAPTLSKTSEATLDSVVARHRSLMSRAERTLMRLRRLQSREANSFVRRQVAGLVSALRRSACQSGVALNDMSAVPRTSTPDLKSMSTLELVGFVRQMQSSEAMSSSLGQLAKTSMLQTSVCPDMSVTADQLSSNLRHLESVVDSDATESSSGGESDDEIEPPPAASDEYIVVSEINNRTKTKLAWASERAMIASRWTWLHAQVSDLEYRIRQQSDLYRQLRSLKGAVTLHDSSPLATDSMHSVSEKPVSDRVVHTVSSSSNGVSSESAVDCNGVSAAMAVNNGTCRAARCLPIQPCRRRRLLQPPGDPWLSAHRKATLSSSLRCTSCHPPATPCALCAGKVNNSVSFGTNLTSLERTALLDASYHPVLSFNADVLTSLQLSECVQHTPLVTSSDPDSELVSCMGKKGLTIKISKANLKCLPSRSFRNLMQGDSSVVVGSKALLVNRADGDYKDFVAGGFGSSEMARTLRDRVALRDALRRKRRFGLRGRHLGRSVTAGGAAGGATTAPRPGRPPRLTQSASSSSLRDALRRQSSRADFDINNVVIPYGATAASSLIDRHEYKEIITPKWREVQLMPLSSNSKSLSVTRPAKQRKLDPSQNNSVFFTSGDEPVVRSSTTSADVNPLDSGSDTDSEVEDLSDEMFAARHLRHEIYEKKQIQPLLNQRRRSRSTRSESEHSLTASANPRSPDMAGSVGSEAVGPESVFTGPLTEETAPSPAAVQHSDATATVYQLPVDQTTALPMVDVRLCRIPTSTLVSLTRTSTLCTEAGHAEVRTPVPEVCRAADCWPVRSFPLVDDDCHKLLVAKASSNNCSDPVSVSSVVSNVAQIEPSVSDTMVIPQSSVDDISAVPVTTL